MKNLIEEIMDSEKYVKYCCYCVQRKEGKPVCCDEAHFIEFRDLDDETQLTIVKEILQDE